MKARRGYSLDSRPAETLRYAHEPGSALPSRFAGGGVGADGGARVHFLSNPSPARSRIQLDTTMKTPSALLSARLAAAEPLESRIAPATLVNPTTVTYTDVDFDLVTIKSSKGTFADAQASSSSFRGRRPA